MAKLKRVKAHFIKEGKREGIDFGSMTNVLFDPNTDLLYVGGVSSKNDIFYILNPKTGEFRSLNYQKIAEKNEVKIHRVFQLDEDGTLYGGTAGLVDMESADNAPGGSLFKYSPKTDRVEKIAIPCPHTYIQEITLDRKRKIIYGLTYPYDFLFKYELKTGRSEILASATFSHDLEIDDKGVLWAVWKPALSERLRFISYNPDKKELTHHLFGPFDEFFCFRKFNKEEEIAIKAIKAYIPRVDTMLNAGDGYIYIGSVDGSLYRFNPEEKKSEWLGKPSIGLRCAGLVMDDRGLIYGVSGMGIGKERPLPELWSYDRGKHSFNRLGPLLDKEKNLFCDFPHGLTIDKKRNRLFVAETDTLERTSAVWECFIEK